MHYVTFKGMTIIMGTVSTLLATNMSSCSQIGVTSIDVLQSYFKP